MNHVMGKNKKKKRTVLKNGGILLEELIVTFDGKTNPISCFSSDQILKATDNFSKSRVISHGFLFNWYRGVIQDRPVSIKKWSSHNPFTFTEAYRDISVSSQMSAHRNSLKLIGCCLEFDIPVLVCEYTEHGPLNRDGGISSGEILPWKVRLKIAKEIASVVTYLHTAFPETIVHRFIDPSNIFIDRNWTAKLSGFGLCIAIPKGEVYVKDYLIISANGYSCNGKVTEKFDIHSFGVVMLVLLSVRSDLNRCLFLTERGGFEEILDKAIWNAPGDDLATIRSQVEAFLRLALRCVRNQRDDTLSSMIEVAKELKLIEKLS